MQNLIHVLLQKVAKGLGITETWLLGLQWRNGGKKVDEKDDDDDDQDGRMVTFSVDQKENGKMQMGCHVMMMMIMIHFAKAG